MDGNATIRKQASRFNNVAPLKPTSARFHARQVYPTATFVSIPRWDPLRGDPRFDKIIEEAKQPLALK